MNPEHCGGGSPPSVVGGRDSLFTASYRAHVQQVTSSLLAVMDAARHKYFVGRGNEIAQFRAAATAAALPFHVLSVYGPGGIGKTSLLRAFQRVCKEENVAAHYLDGRDVEPTAAAFTQALHREGGWGDGTDLTAALADDGGRAVLLVDTYEALRPLDRWMREDFLPRLTTDTLLVLAGRQPLPPAWRIDPGISPLLRALPLRNLTAGESAWYLQCRSVPRERRESVLAFTYGHPLALSLLADAYWHSPQADLIPAESPDLISALLRRFLDDIPSSRHRAALEASAVIRNTTESILEDVLEEADAYELFLWLRSLSFVEATPHGLFPHDSARAVIAADLRWRNPGQFDALLGRASRHYTRRLQERAAEAHERVLTDYAFLHRHNPIIRPFLTPLQEQWQDQPGYVRESARPGDRAVLQQMVARHEGDRSAALFAFWMGHPAADVQVFRDGEGEIRGFVMQLALQNAEGVHHDPAVRAAQDYLDRHAPLRSGEQATLFRFWMDAEHYQAISPVQSLIFVHTVRRYLSTPGLAFSFLPCAAPESWQVILSLADMQRLPEADFTLDGRPFGVFGHDWRVVTPVSWLERIADRLSLFMPTEAVRPEPAPALLVLSQADFADAVKDVLRAFPHPDGLQGNPLLRSRLVLETAEDASDLTEKITVLQDLIREEAEGLEASPSGAKCYRALLHTYLEPAPSQERAAELLDIPYSTFRRHLSRGIERLTKALWQRELGL